MNPITAPLTEREVLAHLYKRENQYKLLKLELLPLVLILGNQLFLSNTKQYSYLVDFLYNNPELPRNSYERLRTGLNKNQFFVTDTLLELFGWEKETQKRDVFKAEVVSFITNQAKLMKFDSRLPWWRKSGTSLQGQTRSNIITPGQLSFRLSIAANLFALNVKIPSITRSFAVEALNATITPVDVTNLFVHLGNGIHEDYFFKETSWVPQIHWVNKSFGSFTKFLASETGLTESNIASMIILGIKSIQNTSRKKKKTETLPSKPSPDLKLFEHDPHRK